MKEIDVERLIEWLGNDGAIAGLEESTLTVSDLHEIAVQLGVTLEKKIRRRDMIIDLVNRNSIRIDKTTDELLAMNCDDLSNYFKNKKVSRTEIFNLLSQFDIHPVTGDKANLTDFAAREIADVGMYLRVAKGAVRSA